MKLWVNGELREAQGSTVEALLVEVMGGVPQSGVAVAVQQQVIPRAQWGSFTLVDGDHVEVIRAVGGG